MPCDIIPACGVRASPQLLDGMGHLSEELAVIMSRLFDVGAAVATPRDTKVWEKIIGGVKGGGGLTLLKNIGRHML